MVGVVLAGGRSRRMGTDKAALTWLTARGSLSWLAHAQARLDFLCAEVVISGHPSLPDIDGEHSGPLTGISAALNRFPDRVCLFLPVDMPRVPVIELQRLAATDCRNACFAHSLLPLRVTSDVEARQAVADSLAADDPVQRSVKAFLARLPSLTTLLPRDASLMVNANTPEDLARMGLTTTNIQTVTGEQTQ